MTDTVTAPTMLDALVGYDSYDSQTRAIHLSLINAVQSPTDVGIDVERHGDSWTVSVCMPDAIGALSILAGLFAAAGLDIISADIFTVRRARRLEDIPRKGVRRVTPSAPTRLLLDIFHIRASGAVSGDIWGAFDRDLRQLVGMVGAGHWEQARDAIIDRVSPVFIAAANQEATLLPVDIEIGTQPGAMDTRLTVRSGDTPGFLFAFTNALAGFTINITRARIRTEGKTADDTFWVTDVHGNPVTGQLANSLRTATALIKQFTYLLPRSPDPGQALRQFGEMIREMLRQPSWTGELAHLESPEVLEMLAGLMGVSRFLWEDFLRMQHENLFPVLVDVPSLRQDRAKADLKSALDGALVDATTLAAKIDALNAFKDREMFRIDLRHIVGSSDFARFAAELSALADVSMAAAADLTYAGLVERHGTPRLADGSPCAWTICALGKFGGRELGFGSDLEILVIYDAEGDTDGPQPEKNSKFFADFVKALRTTLRARQEGVFEIDLRLRPHGNAGALATSFDGAVRYYSPGGGAEQFERMSLVRLRHMAGDTFLGARVEAMRDVFVYGPPPLDIENIRHLRHRQATELVPRGTLNAKYSLGGVVDCEYFVQARQITVGNDPTVRVGNTLEAIEALRVGGYLEPDLAAGLHETYSFHRRVIDALRVVRGHAKDLTIPDVDTREFGYLSHRLGYSEPANLYAAISQRMAFARDLWDRLPG